jgi:tetratricopeptide (TPR) repeat protein
MAQQDYESSVRHLVELGYVDPEDSAARVFARGRLQQVDLKTAADLAARGNFDEAAKILQSLCANDPSWVSPRQLLAEVYFRAGRFSEAQAELDWLTYNAVESPRLSLLAGTIALTRRQIPCAIELLEYAAHVEPELPNIHRLLGTALLRSARLSEAADAFHKAIRRNSADARALDGLAAVCLRQADFDGAADWALQALDHDMKLFEAHVHLGMALAGLHRPQDALKALEASAKVDPTRGAPYRWMAKIAHEQLHEPERAAGYRERGREAVRQRRKQR